MSVSMAATSSSASIPLCNKLPHLPSDYYSSSLTSIPTTHFTPKPKHIKPFKLKPHYTRPFSLLSRSLLFRASAAFDNLDEQSTELSETEAESETEQEEEDEDDEQTEAQSAEAARLFVDHTIPELHGTVRYRDREMENGAKKLNNGSNQQFETPTNITIKGILGLLMANIDSNDERPVISLGMGDPSAYSCFHTTVVAEEAVVDTLRSEKFNGYSPTVGLPQTRTAIAEYLSRDLPYKLSPDDAFVTSGCTQAIDVALSMLARPGVNILLPRPGFPIYELCAAFRHLEVRHFDLLPEKGWEVDLDAVEALADHNTAAMVIINPGNPCGNVYTYQHLTKIAETAKRLKILVIADEVYGHLAFGANPFVPMGVFGSVVPVLTLGSLSKRWIVPGWRLGWFVINDPSDIFRNPKIVERLKKYFDILGGPSTFIQAAVPRILQQTEDVFFTKTINILKQTSDICCERIKEIPCISCPYKPVGSMAVMMKLNVSLLKDISDDIDFCFKLAKEESVIILPGLAVGMKDWIRITFAVEPSSLEEALGRVKSFYHRHSNQQIEY